MNKKRCYIYVRVSTRSQAEEGYSIGEQLDRLNKYADVMGWLVADVFVDPGYSGASITRPGLQQMISVIDGADIVLVDKLDRLSRSLHDTLYLINLFKQHNAAFVSRAEAFDTSGPIGRASLGIMAVFAELEREKIRERTHEGLVGRARSGLWHGTAPTGYCKRKGDDFDGILFKEPYENMQVYEAGMRTIAREPLLDIVKDFNAKGYRLRGNTWDVTTLRRILKNRAYVGEVRFADNWYPGLHEPTFTPEEFNDIQLVLYDRSVANEHYMPGKKYVAPLGGLLWCKQCGAKYHYRKAHADPKRLDGSTRSYRYGYYLCYSRSKCDKKLIRDPDCRNRNYRDTDLDELIFAQIAQLKDNPTYIDSLRSSIDTTARQEAITARLNQISAQISKYMDLYSLGSIPYDLISSRIEPLSSEKQALENELASLREAKPALSTDQVLAFASAFDAVHKSGTPADIHAALQSIIDYIEIDNDNITIHWHF